MDIEYWRLNYKKEKLRLPTLHKWMKEVCRVTGVSDQTVKSCAHLILDAFVKEEKNRG